MLVKGATGGWLPRRFEHGLADRNVWLPPLPDLSRRWSYWPLIYWIVWRNRNMYSQFLLFFLVDLCLTRKLVLMPSWDIGSCKKYMSLSIQVNWPVQKHELTHIFAQSKVVYGKEISNFQRQYIEVIAQVQYSPGASSTNLDLPRLGNG